MPSLANRCVRELESAGVVLQRDPDGALRIPARCPEVGDLVIAFDNDEITVFLGNLTHCHFTPGAGGNLEAPDREGECVRVAVDFVRAVLHDRMVMWRYPNGAGGCYRIEDEDNRMADTPLKGEEVASFLWSGPYRREGAA
jgi:hypothetical protein